MKNLFLLFTLLLVLTGCVNPTLTPEAWQDRTLERVWPLPPDSPRIKLVRMLSDDSSLGQVGRGERLLDWLTGGREDAGGLISPHAVAADGDGRIWVTDAGLSGVHLFDLARQNISFFGGSASHPMMLPLGVAYDRVHDRVYVSDALAAQVYAFESDGDPLVTWRLDKSFERPVGLSVDANGRLYVADALSGVVEVFSAEGRSFLTLDSAGSEYGAMNRPVAVAVDHQGYAFVVDSFGFRVLIFDREGHPIGSIAHLGDSPGSLARPRGVAVDSQGHVYVSDAAFDNIQIFDMAGNTLLFFGGGGSGPGLFSLPAGLAFDREDRLYVVDAQNKRVQVFQYLPRL